jgi:hypothetical protein
LQKNVAANIIIFILHQLDSEIHAGHAQIYIQKHFYKIQFFTFESASAHETYENATHNSENQMNCLKCYLNNGQLRLIRALGGGFWHSRALLSLVVCTTAGARILGISARPG